MNKIVSQSSDSGAGQEVPHTANESTCADLEHGAPVAKIGRLETTPQYIAVAEVARRWSVSSRSVWRMIKSQRLPSYVIGGFRRLRLADVEALECRV